MSRLDTMPVSPLAQQTRGCLGLVVGATLVFLYLPIRQQRAPQTGVLGAVERLHPILSPHAAHHHPYRARTGPTR